MVSLAIGRLRNRLAAPDIAEAWQAAPVLDQATRRLPGVLDTLLPGVLDAAGMPRDAVIALRRLDVRLAVSSEPDQLARDWALAIGAALTEAIRAAVREGQRHASATAARHPVAVTAGNSATPDPAGPDDTAADETGAMAFADVWIAETAILRRLALRLALPWWADAMAPGPLDAASLISEWIERDPARTAHALIALLSAAPSVTDLLTPAAARRLAARLLERIAAAMGTQTSARLPPVESAEDLIRSAWQDTPPASRTMIDAIPADRRALFALAALLAQAPAAGARLAAQTKGGEARAAAQALLSAPPPPEPDTRAEPILKPEMPASIAVMHGGLLLLLRPLAALGMIEALPAAAVAEMLTGIGLLALRRVSRTLPPTARRVLLERDRQLLTVFAGTPPADAPLDTLPIHPGAAERLDAVLAVAPRETGWAAGAARRYFAGLDPFGDHPAQEDPDSLLARILLRPGRLACTPWSADLTWPAADIALRRAGWDIDPGWLPWIGRVVRFHYDETPHDESAEP